MKKHLLALQLFAEGDPAPAVDPKPAVTELEKDIKEKEPAPTAKLTKDEPKYTDEDVNKLIDKKFAEWQKKQEKAVDEAQKLATMNATQKAEYERDQLQKELDEYKRQASLGEMMKTARKMLSDEGITVSDDILTMLVSTEAEETKSAVDGFAKAFTEAVESAVRERIKGETPKKGTGTTTSMTKEQIMGIKDHELRQQAMLENKHLFNL